MEKTIKDFTDFMELRSEMGWTISETVVHDNEPIFDECGNHIENVVVTDHHYNDEDGTPMGCLQIVGNQASWCDFEWDF
jgi:hypothetical protein